MSSGYSFRRPTQRRQCSRLAQPPRLAVGARETPRALSTEKLPTKRRDALTRYRGGRVTVCRLKLNPEMHTESIELTGKISPHQEKGIVIIRKAYDKALVF